MPESYRKFEYETVENRNLLSAVKFRFILNRAPKVSFPSNSVNIPGMTLGVAEQPTYLNDVPHPGDKIQFEDFNLKFLVDEDLTNYLELQHWIRGLGFPENLKEIYDLQDADDNYISMKWGAAMNVYSDGTLLVKTSNERNNYNIVFKGMFPYRLGELNFDATNTDEDYFTADVSFKYMMYNITDSQGEILRPKYD